MNQFFDNWEVRANLLSSMELDSLLLYMSMEAMMADGIYPKLEKLLYLAQKNNRTRQIIDPLSMQGKIESIKIAFRRRWYDIVIWLIDQGVDLHHIDSNQNNLMHSVLKNYNPSVDRDIDASLACACVVKLIESGVDVNYLGVYKFPPIYSAAAKRLYKVVIYLIDHGAANVHYIDDNQNNLLHVVLYECNSHDIDGLLSCVIKLVVAGVGINNLNKFKKAPISIAAEKNIYKVLIYLIDHDADVHYISDGKQNNLLQLMLYNCTAHSIDELLSCVIKLVESGVRINHLNESKEAPISIAIAKRLTKVVIYMIDQGVDLHYIDNEGMNQLQAVLHSYHVYGNDDIDALSQCVVKLVQRGVHVNHLDKYGNAAIVIAARKGLYNVVLHLIKHGAHVHHIINQNNLLHTVLEYPTDMSPDRFNNYTEKKNIRANIDDLLPCVVKLVEAGIDVNQLNKDNLTPIFIAAKNRLYKVVMHMFKVYSFTELMSPHNGVKLLYEVLACKKLELLDYYIRSKLTVNGYTSDGENMLHLLARVNYDYSLDKFNWLLNDELDINHPDSKTNTPAMVAAVLLNSKYLELFTHHPRININAQNNQGHTALHLCIIGFAMVIDCLNERQENAVVEVYCRRIYPIYMDCVDILLAAVGIDVNIPDSGGITALMMAAKKNDRFLIRKLVNAGAMVNYNGKSALQHLDIYESVFDLSFKLLASAAGRMLLDLPCINGNTLIQETLRFPRCWDPRTTVSFIRYLVGENVCLESLVTSSVESSYNQIDMRELSSPERDELRKLLYLSGAPEDVVVATLNFDKDDTNVERDENRRLLYLRGAPDEETVQQLTQGEDGDEQADAFHSRHQEIFNNFCCNISLMSLSRRVIRQKLGLGIEEKIVDLDLPTELHDFLLLKDVLSPKDYSINNIDDGCNDYDDDDGFIFYGTDKAKAEDNTDLVWYGDSDDDDEWYSYGYNEDANCGDDDIYKDYSHYNYWSDDDDDDDDDYDDYDDDDDDDDDNTCSMLDSMLMKYYASRNTMKV